jgi:hypothetical protein
MEETKGYTPSTKTCELSNDQKETLRKLVMEAELGGHLAVRKSISSSSTRIHPKPLPESTKDITKADLDGANIQLILERWKFVLGPSDIFPHPPPPPPPLPKQLGPFQWNPITFDNGVPVGGWAELTLFQNGSYVFAGHFHDSGAPSYNSSLVWVMKDTVTNIAYTLQHTGHMAGTFESGSRDDNWNNQSTNAQLAAAWPTLSLNWTYSIEAQMNGDFNSILSQALGSVGVVLGVVALAV